MAIERNDLNTLNNVQIKSENNSLQSAKLEARKSFFINF